MSDSDTLLRDWRRLLFGVRKSIRYHTCRRAFFDRLHYGNLVVALVFSSAAVGALIKSAPSTELALWATAVASVLSAINVVTRSAERARTHHDFARRFIEIEKEMLSIAEPTPVDLARLRNERLAIEAEEPPPKIILDAICHNDEVRAMGADAGQYIPVGFVQRQLAHFGNWGAGGLEKRNRQTTPARP